MSPGISSLLILHQTGILFPADNFINSFHIRIHLIQKGFFCLVADTGSSGGTELPGNRHHASPCTVGIQIPAGHQRRQMGMEGCDELSHLVSTSL